MDVMYTLFKALCIFPN